jgi:hypothetical protein
VAVQLVLGASDAPHVVDDCEKSPGLAPPKDGDPRVTVVFVLLRIVITRPALVDATVTLP